MLEASRGKQLALSRIRADRDEVRIEDEIRREEARLEAIERRLEALGADRETARWYQRGRRADLDRHIDQVRDNRRRTRAAVDRLRAELDERPRQPLPLSMRAGDPLGAFRPSEARTAPRQARERAPDRNLGLER
jgi:hypothetical protein